MKGGLAQAADDLKTVEIRRDVNTIAASRWAAQTARSRMLFSIFNKNLIFKSASKKRRRCQLL